MRDEFVWFILSAGVELVWFGEEQSVFDWYILSAGVELLMLD